MARLNVEIKDDIYHRVVEHAKSDGRTVSDVVRVLINQWLLDKEYLLQLLQQDPNANEPSRNGMQSIAKPTENKT